MIVQLVIAGRIYVAKGRHEDQPRDYVEVTGPGLAGPAEYAIDDGEWRRIGAEAYLSRAIRYTVDNIVLAKLLDGAGL